MINKPDNTIRRVLRSVFLFIVLLFSISLSAETPRDSLSAEQAKIKNKSTTLFIVKGTIITNLDYVKGKITISEAVFTETDHKSAYTERIPQAKEVKKTEAASVVEKKTENADALETRILPVRQNEKSLLGGSKNHAVAIAVSSAKNEQKKYVNGSLLHETNFYPHSFDVHHQKNKNQNSFFFFPKNEFLSFTQGIRPPPMA